MVTAPLEAPERPAEHVGDWTPHDVAEWLYTQARAAYTRRGRGVPVSWMQARG